MSAHWSKSVTTVSTFPPPGTFTKSAEEIAEIMARPEVSPLGIVSGVRMILYFLNRGGSTIQEERKQELRKAIVLLRKKDQPPWTKNLPTVCETCKEPFQDKFYVCRRISDKQLVIVCEKHYPVGDDSECRSYMKVAKGTFLGA